MRVEDKSYSLMGLSLFSTRQFCDENDFLYMPLAHFPWLSYSQLNDLTYGII